MVEKFGDSSICVEDEIEDAKIEMAFSLGSSDKRVPLSKLANPEKRPSLTNLYCKLMTLFASTYVCETTFSALTQIKSKYRSCLSIEALDPLIRSTVSKGKPNFEKLLDGMKEFHGSHGSSSNSA